MSDDRPDLASLVASPWDDDDDVHRSNGGRWPIVIGLAVGALAVVGGFWVARSTNEAGAVPDPSTVESTVVVTSTLPSSAVGDAPFPPGYEPVTDLIAIKPIRGFEANDALFITMSTAVRRGFDPSRSAPFQSGQWTLETSAGESLMSAGTVVNFSSPGVLSIVFPLEGRTDVVPTQLTLDQRWERDDVFQSADLNVDGLPYELSEPLDVSLGPSTLRIDSLSLTADSGQLEWTVLDDRQAAVQLWLILGSQSDPASFYRPSDSGRFGRFGPSGAFLQPDGSSGTVILVSENPGTDGELNGQATLDLQVALFTVAPGNARFDVSDLPIDRPG